MEWIKNKQPEEKLNVLAFCPMGNLGHPFMAVAYRVGNDWFDADDHGYFDTPMPVTHWMLLPEPPK